MLLIIHDRLGSYVPRCTTGNKARHEFRSDSLDPHREVPGFDQLRPTGILRYWDTPDPPAEAYHQREELVARYDDPIVGQVIEHTSEQGEGAVENGGRQQELAGLRAIKLQQERASEVPIEPRGDSIPHISEDLAGEAFINRANLYCLAQFLELPSCTVGIVDCPP
jgi:hypothetical protein